MRLSPRISFEGQVYVENLGSWTKLRSIDLSLFGVKVNLNGFRPEVNEKLKIKITYNGSAVELKGKFYKKYSENYGVILFEEDAENLAHTIGKLITQIIKERGRCPYCKAKLKTFEKICNSCGMPLDFTNEKVVDALKNLRLGEVILEYSYSVFEEDSCGEIVGESPAIKRVHELINKYAHTDYPVLVLGETGTGKELVAREIHRRSKRRGKPFIAINCAAIPSELIEAELFGYEKGAFTGATKTKRGKIELAHGGTLFLDEIGDLPMEVQAKFLRFLETLTFERLGGEESIKADVRIISATNRNLEELVRKGRFRKDLYYRLKVLVVELPPLRERNGDVVLLAEHFLKKFSKELGKELKGFTEEALEAIRNYHWPGNVRELMNIIRRAVVIAEGELIDVKDLSLESPITVVSSTEAWETFNLKENVAKLEKSLVEKAYRYTGGNITKMASMLGVSRPTVYKLLEKYGFKIQ